jgi:uncharacterized protein YbjT (DUF2867 family)
VIGVLGATGRLGGNVAAALAERGVKARARVRRPSAGLPLPAVHAELDAPAALAAALDVVDRLLLLTAHGADQERHEAALIDAAVAAGVRRVVKISGSAASLGPNGPSATVVAHRRSEQRIERGGMAFVFLRPSFYMHNLVETDRADGRPHRRARRPVRPRADRHARRARCRCLRDQCAARGRGSRPRLATHRAAGGHLSQDRRAPRRPSRKSAVEAHHSRHAPPRRTSVRGRARGADDRLLRGGQRRGRDEPRRAPNRAASAPGRGLPRRARERLRSGRARSPRIVSHTTNKEL